MGAQSGRCVVCKSLIVRGGWVCDGCHRPRKALLKLPEFAGEKWRRLADEQESLPPKEAAREGGEGSPDDGAGC